MPDQETPTARRSLLVAAIYGLWSLMAAALAAPAAVYLLLPPRARRGSESVEIGELSQLALGVPEEVAFRRNRLDGWKLTSEKAAVWLVRRSENDVVAFAPQCTHLGCAYHWDERRKNFLCPCHSSTFGIDGRVLSGPAPRPLDRYDVKIENGRLLLGPLRPPAEA
jgi:menaquinol-cytochrome c reductase iron-sulfur subunit